jgi:hypothetical protein
MLVDFSAHCEYTFLMNKKMYYWLVLGIVLMVIGGLIYAVFRKEDYVFLSLLKKIGVDYSVLRHNGLSVKSNARIFLIYSLPGGLWQLSGLIITGIIWKNNVKYFLLYSFAVAALSIAHEFSQKLKFISGTFDPADIAVLLCSYITGIALYFLFIRDGGLLNRKYE